MSIEEEPIVSTIRNQVYQILKSKIFDGDYVPNQRLLEIELAKSLHVSRSPVREAFHQLASDGLVVEIPNKGVFVRKFNSKDIDDIFEFRVLMESNAIQKSNENLTPDLKKSLNYYIDKLNKSYEENNKKEYIKYDTQLHEAIIYLSGNSLIESTYSKVQSMIQPFRIYSLKSNLRFDDSIIEHQEIVQSILCGNTKKAEEINRRHLTLAKEKIIEYMNSSEYPAE